MLVETTHRVNYSEVDQMGVVYHANYLVWLDVARCELLRQAGMTYKELEGKGFFLAVSEARVRYKRAARYPCVCGSRLRFSIPPIRCRWNVADGFWFAR